MVTASARGAEPATLGTDVEGAGVRSDVMVSRQPVEAGSCDRSKPFGLRCTSSDSAVVTCVGVETLG